MTTMREVFCGAVSQGAAPYCFMEEKICSFFGHRKIEATESLSEKLKAEILKAIGFGVRTFYFGGFGAFDALAHKTVTEIKDLHPELQLKRIFCAPTEYYLRKIGRYTRSEDYEDAIYLEPSFKGWYKSIYFRNCAMIDKSSFLCFYAEARNNSGAYKALKYAEKKKKQIINLYA